MFNLVSKNLRIELYLNNINYRYLTANQFNLISIQLLNMLLGFFIATALSTIQAQTGDWSIVVAAIIVTNQELISKMVYQIPYLKDTESKNTMRKFLKYCNSLKIGIIYGLFIDAFKLGS